MLLRSGWTVNIQKKEIRMFNYRSNLFDFYFILLPVLPINIFVQYSNGELRLNGNSDWIVLLTSHLPENNMRELIC